MPAKTRARPPRVPAMEIGLVRALVALVSLSSVSRAAEALGQSQPQMSATLRRIREVLRDPILVRGSQGMRPTEHALALLAPARRILGDVQALVAERRQFSPDTLERALRLAIPDFISAPLQAAVLSEIRAAAPLAAVVVCSVRSESHGVELLESGEADVLIESNEVRSANVRRSVLFEDPVLAVAARRHREVRDGMSIDAYLQLPHVAAAPASGTRPGLVDRMLAERGHTRRVVAWVPYFNTLPQLLARSDLVFTTSAHMARHFGRQAELQLFAPPIKLPRIRFSLMWHDRLHRSAEHRWLRNLIHGTVSGQLEQ